MSIVNKIISSVRIATGLQCHYHSDGELDRIFDNAPLPCAFFTLLTDAEIINESSQMRERAEVAVFFCEKTDFDFGSIENEAILSRMRTLAFKWAANLGDDLAIVGELQSQRIYDRFDVNVTAYGIRCTLEELVGISKCANV